MKKTLSILLALLCALSLITGCAVTEQSPETTAPTQPVTAPDDGTSPPPTQPIDPNKIGISLPTEELPRWAQDGARLKAQLEDLGYDVTLQFGENSVAAQVTQIEDMIADGCKLLIIAPLEGDSLGTVLQKAKERNITVIAYDRLIMCTPDVDYFVTFNTSLTAIPMGRLQGQFIVDALDLKHAEGPFNIEFVEGDPGDGNSILFYIGEMDILEPYINSGKLVIVSGQKEYYPCSSPEWRTEAAQQRMESILQEYYSDRPLHAVCCANDSTAQGAIAALESSYSGDIYPIVTGMDCDIQSVKYMLAGKQSMSVFRDTRDVATQTVKMADDIMQGRQPEINDTSSCDNGVKVIPAFVCTPVVVTTDNYREYLIDSGYYTESDLS